MIARLANGILAVAGAGLGAQFPAFYQQYLQRLGGRLDQARIEAERIGGAAEAAGLRVADYVERLIANADPVVRSTGAIHAAALTDARELASSRAALAGATGIERPSAFVGHFDRDIALSTLHDFQPALPLTLEAAAYALAGLLLATLLASAFATALRARA